MKGLRFNVVFIPFTLGRRLGRIAFGDDINVTFQIAFGTSRDVFRIGK
jgi:hypothetical protein